MNTSEDLPPFFPPLPAPALNNSSGFWLQVHPREEHFDVPPQFKKQRVSDDAPPANPNRGQRQVSGSLPPPPVHSISLPQNSSQGNKVSRLFFKTRLCMKFKLGSCPYGQNCSFAHGPEELRRAPPNWPSLVAGLDDERSAGGLSERQRLNKLKICRKYYNGEVCPYGERCTFAHVEPGSLKECSAFNAGVAEASNPPAVSSLCGACDLEANGSSSSSGDGNGSHHKSCIWKTKKCHKWELTGHCPFGENCQFTHGTAGDSAPAPPGRTSFPGKQKGFLRLRGLKKISNIYADWIEDLPLNPRNN
ncbi:hypothetical protein Taro_044382 [Colocasia esculenta]|uniref:C3H1-type domain-containing protein n=1 Tax=Colocasia esculenta TaxID=4460 RepID=A0A843X2L3_COLES|nr:hypothetical protein [Colocasia esculenta]